MNFKELVETVSGLSCFTVGFLSAGKQPDHIRPSVNRWVKDGKLIKLHKGLYALAEPWRKSSLEPFVIANKLKTPSYISLQSALAFYGMIPEYVPRVTSITTGRPQTIHTPVANFDFRHIRKKHFHGFTQMQLSSGQNAFIACPEKALLDLIYLTPGGDRPEYVEQLRLQDISKVSRPTLWNLANEMNRPKLKRACRMIETMIEQGEGTVL